MLITIRQPLNPRLPVLISPVAKQGDLEVPYGPSKLRLHSNRCQGRRKGENTNVGEHVFYLAHREVL